VTKPGNTDGELAGRSSGKGTPMLKVLEGGKNGNGQNEEGLAISLDELTREGARRMIAAALAVEVDDYVSRRAVAVDDYVGQRAGERDEHGHALVVRNGAARPRSVTVGAGTIEVCAPRV
jgi:putative transposase